MNILSRNKSLLIITGVLIALVITGYIFLKPGNTAVGDDALYKWVTSETDYVFYKNNPEILPTSSETERAHDDFMRVRINKKAASVLGADGTVPEGSFFPDSSIIVKEIYSDKTSSSPDLLAVMVKLKGAKNNGNDWLWAEYTPKGETEYSVEKEGKVCVKCHRPGRDFVRIFDIVK
ncbi:MAG: hypothetical protein EHM58_10385 [Ignavibacteriae bacterium]|nr:MAG: hypothetical protein EHM58_10385 [Ignavibacteriota bacterium]